MKNKHIDILRDVAISLEKDHKQVSIDLMGLALEKRPNGGFIRNKFTEYSEHLEVSNDVIPSLIMALELVKNSSHFDPLLEGCLEFSPKNAELLKLKNDNSFILELKNEVSKLHSKIELLRNKFNLMHKALCYSDALKVKEIDDHAAKLSPVEFFDKGSDETLIVFGGMATRPSMPPKEFFASFSERHINIIFVKDFQQCWYQNGLMGLSDDMESTVDYLKSLIPSRTKKLTCLGTSAGGYAAIRIGVDLNASRILSFAPQTNISKAVFNKFKSLDSRSNEMNFKDELDLSLFLESSDYKGKIDLFFGDQNQSDKAAAENVADYVDLHPFPTQDHNVASYLKSNELLSDILESI